MIQPVKQPQPKKTTKEDITYPTVVTRKDLGGLKVQMSKKVSLPGIYTSHHAAQKAIDKELAMSRVAAINRKKKDK